MAGLFNSILSRPVCSVLTYIPSRNHKGYLPFEGRVPNLDTEEGKLILQTKALNFKPVKRIHFKVDPLHPRASSIRQVTWIKNVLLICNADKII